MSRPRVGVAVVALVERIELVRELLADLAGQTEGPAEVWLVVQDRSDEKLEPEIQGLPSDFARLSLRVRGNPQRNLASARNRILRECGTDVLVFMDDDARMPSRAIERVADGFTWYPDATVITFQAEWIGGDGRAGRYAPQAHARRTLRSVTDVASIEMVVSVEDVRRLGVQFDERFGSGARFKTGEEFVLLADILRKGGNVHYVPLEVASHPSETSGTRLDEQMFEAKGAVFRRVFGIPGLAVGALFVVRKLVSAEIRCAPLPAFRGVVSGWRQLR